MTTSVILFLVAVLCGLLFAGVGVYHQRHVERRPWRAVTWKPLTWLLVGCVAFGGLAFLIDSGVAGQTLFEAETPGPGAGGPAEHVWAFPVEHPEATHTLGVFANHHAPGDGPTDVAVQLVDGRGAVLVDETRTLDVRCTDLTDCDWDSFYRDFTPSAGGDLTLTVTLLGADVPELHVWVGDDEKTDGERIPGY